MSNADMVSTSAFVTRSACERKGHLPIAIPQGELYPAGGIGIAEFHCQRCGKVVTEKGELIND